MENRHPPELEMNLQGEFVTPRKPPVSARILFWAIVVAAVAGAITVAAIAMWVAAMILPVALVAGVVAWAMWRYRLWRMQRTMAGQRGVWQPR
jgi:hypothetical protein